MLNLSDLLSEKAHIAVNLLSLLFQVFQNFVLAGVKSHQFPWSHTLTFFLFFYPFLQLLIFIFKNINFGFLIFDKLTLFEILELLIFLKILKI